MQKIFIKSLIAFGLLCNVMCAYAISGSCGASATWSFNSETGVLKIEGVGKMYDYNSTKSSKPWSYYTIKEVQILEGITSVGDFSFQDFTSIEKVSIANSVTSVGTQAFYCCSGISSLTIDSGVNKISIGQNAFSDCKNIKNLDLPGTVSMSNGAFAHCTNLLSVKIGYGVKSIGYYAFNGCSKLETVVIPGSVTRIGEGAFNDCVALEEVVIPASVKQIDEYAFSGCSALTSVTNLAEEPLAIDMWRFTMTPTDKTLHVLKGLKSKYEASSWANYFTTIVDDIEEITKIDLVDGIPYERDYSTEIPLSYTRTFNNTSFQALYVPFAMNYSDWADDFVIYRINNVHQYDDNDDGVYDRTILEVLKLKEGSHTNANTPYIIKALTMGEKTIELENATLEQSKENEFTVSSWNELYTFGGTYHNITDMYTRDYYALAGGELVRATSDAVVLKPYRWYMSITDRNNQSVSSAKKIDIEIVGEESTTGVTMYPSVDNRNTDAIYDITGRKVSSMGKHGIYIINNKKVLK